MKAVHVAASPLSLGFLRGQAGFMAAAGIELHVVSSPGQLLDSFGAEEGVPAHPVPISRSVTPVKDLAALWKLVRLFRRVRADIVHVHTPKAALLGMIAAWAARVPVRVHHLRGLPSSTATGPVGRLLSWSDRVACGLAQRVVCVSPSLRREALDARICPASKLVVLGHGSGQGVDARGRFDPARFSAADRRQRREALGIPEDAVVLGYVGRLTLDKGLRELQGAWELLRDRYPGLHLLLAGSPDDRAPLPTDLRARFDLDRRVHSVGWTNDVPAVYSVIDILVLPTYREGFPNVVLEAGAMELPVVATQVTGCVDAVVGGKTGMLVPPRDAESLADAIGAYVATPALRREHGRVARERVLQQFRPEALWEGLLREYTSLAANSSTLPRS